MSLLIRSHDALVSECDALREECEQLQMQIYSLNGSNKQLLESAAELQNENRLLKQAIKKALEGLGYVSSL